MPAHKEIRPRALNLLTIPTRSVILPEGVIAMRLRELLRQADTLLLTLLYPRRTLCLCCGRLSHGTRLCPDCAAELVNFRLEGDLCPQCGHVLHTSPCPFCEGDVPGPMRSVWTHRGAPRQLVLRLKHQCVAGAAEVLALGMAERAQDFQLPGDTVVTWVTMPRSRMKRRGIDHGRVLAEHLAHRLYLPCRPLLIRRDHGRTQRGLNRHQRLHNLDGLFSCDAPIPHAVLLVDDVMTTSATVRVCADALLQAGATQVFILTATQA